MKRFTLKQTSTNYEHLKSVRKTVAPPPKAFASMKVYNRNKFKQLDN